MHPETQPRPPTVGAQEGPNGEDAQEAKMPTPPTPLQSCDSLRVLVDPAHPLPPDASIRQIIETVYDKLHNTFGLRRERPHDVSGLRARLAAIPWRCTTSVSGSTTNSTVPDYLSLIS